MKLFLKAQACNQKVANRVQELMKNPKGMTFVEIIVLISVILVIATVLFLMRDAITGFLNKATTQVNGLKVS